MCSLLKKVWNKKDLKYKFTCLITAKKFLTCIQDKLKLNKTFIQLREIQSVLHIYIEYLLSYKQDILVKISDRSSQLQLESTALRCRQTKRLSEKKAREKRYEITVR